MGAHRFTWGWRGCRSCNARRAHPRQRPSQEDLCANLPGRMVFRREVLLCVDGPEPLFDLSGNSWQGARDSRAGGQIVARTACVWNQPRGRATRTSRRTSDRARFSVRPGPTRRYSFSPRPTCSAIFFGYLCIDGQGWQLIHRVSRHALRASIESAAVAADDEVVQLVHAPHVTPVLLSRR